MWKCKVCAHHLNLPLLLFSLFAIAAGGGLSAETRRAVLVGIKTYNPDAATRLRLEQAVKPGKVRRPAVIGDATYWRFEDLEGPLNDIDLMQGVLQSFGFKDFVILKEYDATADAILAALQKNLVDDAQTGDVRFFYYSGHGNHVRNRASMEHGEDQTIVPADNWRNVPDIRDKEISRILWQAAKKGVKVTFVSDSCHSGSLSRGLWNARGKTRSSSGSRARDSVTSRILNEAEANDPGVIDPATGQPLDPERLGVLTLAAAQSTDEAREIQDEDGRWHGAFTLSLARALRSPTEPMDRVFLRSLAELRAESLPQQPVMGGAGRAQKGIFGDDADPGAGLTVAVVSVSGKDAQVRGGTAIGIYPGCRMKSIQTPVVQLEITGSVGISLSTARIVGDGSVQVGELFVLDRWTVPSTSSLRVYIPPTAPVAAVFKTALEIGKLRKDAAVQWLEDATADHPTDVMSWTGASWILERNPTAGTAANLGAEPTAEAVKKLLSAKARFLLLLPPTTELAAAIPLGDANHSAVLVQGGGRKVTTSVGAHYWFYGRLKGDEVEYAWLLPDATEEGVRALAGETKNAKLRYLPMPIRSDWIKLPDSPDAIRLAGANLTDKALRLARIRAWLALRTPAMQSSFPYHLTLKNVDTGQFHMTGDFKDQEKYKLYLQADAAELKKSSNLAQRWIYVFVVDHSGTGTLVFPALGHGNEGNQLPYAIRDEKPRFEPLIPISGDAPYDFMISAPFGIDTCFLLTTEEKIDNTEVLQFDGLRSKGETRGLGNSANPLADLLADIGSATRAVPKPVPAHWSIESITLRSVAAK